MKKITIDGQKFNNIEEFYIEIDKVLTKDFKSGHNLDSLNDLLKGGFGVHKYGEPLIIKWLNYQKSKKNLGDKFILQIFEIIIFLNNDGHNIKIVLY